jgi:aquaporin Z
VTDTTAGRPGSKADLRSPGNPHDERRSEPVRPRDPPLQVRAIGELAGTFALTFVAVAADTAGRLTNGEVGAAARAAAPALLVMAFVYALGDTSGAHFNPAVTLGFTLRGLFPVRWLALYVAAQLVGAIAAALLLVAAFGPAVEAGVSTPHVPVLTALGLEVILTALLISVVLGTADRYRIVGPSAAIAVGATIALSGLIAIPLEGASMNPARSLGPALATLQLENLWIYWLGPAAGAVLAVILTRVLHGPAPRDVKQVEAATGGTPD